MSDSVRPHRWQPTRLRRPWDSPGKNTGVACRFLPWLPFLLWLPFPSFFWDPYNLNLDAFDIVPEVSETILSSFHSFNFILLFRSYFHHFIFQLTDSFFYFKYSAINSSYSIFNFSNCVVCLCRFMF